MNAVPNIIDNQMTTYGWIITEDHLDPEPTDGTSVGVMGPGRMSAEVLHALESGAGDEFTMRDDDGILYVTGRGVDLTGEWDEEACYAPLSDYGAGGLGCVEVSWTNHKERDCG